MMERSEQLAELLQNWKPPAELAGSLPRPVRLSRRGSALAVAISIMSLVGIGSAIGLSLQKANEQRIEEQLSRDGAPADAVITRLWQTSDKDHRPRVTYQFPYNGLHYEGVSEPPRATWRELRTGARLPIRYLPSTPAVSRPVLWKEETVPLSLILFIGLFLPCFGGFLARPILQQRRLLAEGRTAPGIVTGYRRTRKCQLLYGEFALPGGSVGQIRGAQTRTYPDIGSTICILYDRESPRRNSPYPLMLVDSAKVHGKIWLLSCYRR